MEERVKTPGDIKGFLNALYGGKGERGEVGFSVREGPIWENLGRLRRTRLVGESVLEWYVGEYGRSGVGASGRFLFLSMFEKFVGNAEQLLMRLLYQ